MSRQLLSISIKLALTPPPCYHAAAMPVAAPHSRTQPALADLLRYVENVAREGRGQGGRQQQNETERGNINERGRNET